MNVIFHHNDMDGYTSAHVVATAIRENSKEKIKFIECNYNNSVPSGNRINDGDTVYIVDYSFTSATVNDLIDICNKADKVTWIDHHRSSTELLKKEHLNTFIDSKLKTFINIEYCGAVLSWFAMHYNTSKVDTNKPMPSFLILVDSWDCWKHNIPNTIKFKYGLETFSWDPEDEQNIIYQLLEESRRKIDDRSLTFKIIETGNIIKHYIDKENDKLLSGYSYEAEFEKYTCLVVNSNRKSSLIFKDMIDKYPFCIVWSYKNNVYSYSIYSSDSSIDCSKIAEKYGGGGHLGAAGFKSHKYLLNDINN